MFGIYNYFTKSFKIFVLLTFYFIIPKNLKGKYILGSIYILGPSFIKLGQSLSTRPDIIGKKNAEILAELQDKVPAFSSKYIKKRVEKSFKKSMNELYLDFSEEPCAAASISQVHRAKTLKGEDVAVKILRPQIRKLFKQDIKYFYFGANILDKFTKFKRLKIPLVIKLFEDTIIRELNLTNEAASASELKENLKNDHEIYVPNIYWDLTTHEILTTEWINGTPIYDLEKLKAKNINLVKLSEILAITFFNQTYRDGFFHADMHPGNILVGDDGKIIFIDFGIMGRFDYDTRIFVAEILRGFITRDYDYVAEIHFKAGYIPQNQSKAAFAGACRAVGEPIVGMSVNDISVARLLSQLFLMTEEFQMETQIQLLWFQKSLIIIEGVVSKLNPQVNLWKLAEPWIKNWAKDNLGPKAQIKRTINDIKEVFETLHQLKYNLKLYNQYIENKLKVKKAENNSVPNMLLYIILFINLLIITFLI